MEPQRADSPNDATVTLHLLDTTIGRSLQVWRVGGRSVVTIGRAEDCDVTIADPYVSRKHAELERRGAQWWVVSRGRNGVIVDGRKVEEAPLTAGQVFRLGDTGPMLRFLEMTEEENSATLYHEVDKIALFQVDPSKLQQEVRQITESEYFQDLQKKAGQMRKKDT